MKDFTIFRTGSQRGVNTFMSGEGAIEHPMSTHSAPDGTSRKPAGIKAIIRCMAAMFVMLFTLGVSNMWGANWAQIRLYSNTTTLGKVNKAVKTDGTTATTPTTSWAFRNDSAKTAGTGACTYNNVVHGQFEADNQGVNYTKNTYKYFAYAKAESGCEFVKWEIYNGKSKITSSDMDTASTTVDGCNRLTITHIKGNSSSMPTYYVKAIFKTNTKTITCDQPSNGSYTVDIDRNGTAEKTVPSDASFEITPGSSVRLVATPASGYSLYRWYYRAGNSTRVALVPTSSSTTDNVTTAEVSISAAATAIGVEFKRKKEFKVSYKNAVFTGSDYRIYTTGNLYPSASAEDKTYTLYEGESMDLIFIYESPSTRGVDFKNWYYTVAGSSTKHTVSTHVEASTGRIIYTLSYSTLAGITGTPTFAVDVVEKSTRSLTFLSGDRGAYRAGFKDANGNGTVHPDLTTANTSDQYFTINKNASDAAHDLYEDDRLFLEHTSAQADETDVNYLFHSWYWQGDDAVKHPLGDGIVTTIDTLLPEEAKKVGVTFIEAITKNITFLANEHGNYKVNGVTYNNGEKGKFDKNGITVSAGSDRTVNNVLISSAITLSNPVSDDPSAYSFYRWYYVNEDGVKKTLANLEATATVVLPSEAVSVGMEFSQAGDYAVSGLYFNSLSDAIQAAQAELKTASSSTIVVARDATVPAGNYTIPANTTLLIPYQEGQVSPSNLRVITKADPYIGAYRTLTLADGAHLEVYGTIEVSGCQTTGGYDGQGDDVPSRTGGPYYGRMHMIGNSSITLNADAKLYAWGYVTGESENGNYQCEIDVRRGANVYEHFQIADWKGAFPSVEITSYTNETTYHVLPICQYYIQNVEVPARYRPGSRLRGAAAINVDIRDQKTKSAGVVFAMNDVGLVGIKYPDSPEESDKAVFLLNDKDESEDTWVRKFYDPSTDQQVYEINNSADVGSLVMYVTIPGIGNVLGRPQGMANRDRINVDSRAYQFPITNNFKMHLLSGNMYITQMTEMLPGSVIEIDKQSTLTINNNAKGNTPNDIALLFYDANDWGQFVYQNINTDTKERSWGYGSRVKYRPEDVPDVRNISTKTSQGNAQLIVHGTVDVQGDLYTTSHGASITSTIEDAGTIIFSKKAPASVGPTYQVSALSGGNNPTFTAINRVPAWLKNDAKSVYSENDGFTETADSPADKSFCFIDVDGDSKGEWVSLSNDGCFVTDGTDYYAKPQEYVALANGKTANADHTYSDKAGAGRLFIVMDDCQWWEVENVDNLYHCLHPDNDTYYYWDDSDENPAKHTWKEKKFAITWKNWDGAKIRDANYPDDPTYIDPYMLTYGVTPKYLHTNPTRPDDVDYTYNFIGWTPALAPVTGDATYTAVYEKIQKKYTIIFNDASGNEITRQQLALGETPTPPTIAKTSYWTPGIGAVTGNTTYTLTLGTPEAYTIKFVNFDGSTHSQEYYALGADIDIPSDPTRPATSENTYDFIGWSPAISAGAKVTGNATYTALYEASPKTYAIRFYKEDGTTQIGETQNLVLGATPVVPEYNKEATAQYTYATEWVDKTTINLAENKWLKSVRTVTGAADYQAHFAATLNKYTLKLQSNNNSVCTFTGAGVYNYGTTNLAVYATIAEGYTFDHWDGVDWNTTNGTIAELTGDVTLTLYVKPTGSAVNNLEVSINDETDISAATQYDNFVLTSDGTQHSGQVTNAQNIELFGNAYFDLAINAKNHKWYGVAVPWQVDATSGISVNGKTLVLGKDFDIIYYDGARRAAEGKKKCWKYVENDGDKTLQPGRLYMIGLMMDANIIRFKKKAQAALLTTSTSVTAHPQTTGDDTDANWNGVANPALFHAFVNPGVIAAQVYNPESNGYDPIEMDDAKFVVGQGAFVQAPADKSIVVTYGGAYAAAPRRARAEEAPLYDVRIAPAEGNYTDRLFVTVDDEKEADKYVIGKDLAKLGVSKSVAQMWINRYNTELCLNTMTMENGVAEYPLSIFAPKAGEYTITNEQSSMSNEYTLYLTFNGEAIWNLSDAAYTGTFDAGTTSAYGLRISARAPQITTGIDEAVVDAKGETRKVLIDNQVFIIRGENVYSVDGQIVK